MARFNNSEKTDMVLVLGRCQGNTREAARAYGERYPDRITPSPKTFSDVLRNLRAHGSFRKPYDASQRRAANNDRDELLLAAVHASPSTSTRAIAADLDLPQTTVWRTLHKHKFHPFHIHLHHALTGEDSLRRVEFCMTMREMLEQDPGFLENILMSDEATFHRDANVNIHNAHYWSRENPFWLRQDNHQVRFSLNVWCGILGDQVVGPFFLPKHLTGEAYLHFLRTELSEFLDDLPVAVLGRTWFQQDGATPHYARDVRDYLDRLFPHKWIGRGGPIAWPARSPDLSSLDFFLWGYVKSLVYVTAPGTAAELQQRIRDAVSTITAHQLARVRASTRQRIEDCLTADGWHFEHRC